VTGVKRARHPLGVGERPTLGDQGARKLIGQFLGGDDVAGERDQPATQLRRRRAGVAVGRNDDVAGRDVAA